MSTSRCWVLSSELTVIQPVVEDIVGLCRDAGFSSKQCRLNVPVAVTEAVANAILRQCLRCLATRRGQCGSGRAAARRGGV